MAKEKLDREAQEKAKLEKERAKWRKQEAKRRQKKTAKVKFNPSSKLAKGLGIALAAVLVLALAAGIGAQAGLPQILLPVLKVGSITVNAPEWAYYFYTTYSQMASENQQMESYYSQLGMDLPMDIYSSPFGQMYTDPDTSEEVKLEDYLTGVTNESIRELLTLYQEAQKNNITLSEENKQKIDESIEELKTSAGGAGVGPSAYLELNYTKGINVSKFRSIQERQYLAQQFITQKSEELKALYPDDKLLEEYNEDPSLWQAVSLRIYSQFTTTTLVPRDEETEEELAVRQEEASAEAKQKAEDYLAAVTDEASFIAQANEYNDADVTPDYNADTDTSYYRADYETLSGSSYAYGDTKPLADWAYAEGRAAGDKAIIQTNGAYLVVYVVDPPYQVSTVDYYSITVDYPTPEEDETLTDEQIAETRAKAEAMMTEWIDAGGTAEAFAQMVKNNTPEEETTEEEATEEDADEDEEEEEEKPAGLTEQASPGSGNTALDNWLFASTRKARDHVLLETNTGFMVVMYAGQHTRENGGPDYLWLTTLANKHISEDYEVYLADALEKYEVTEKSSGLEYALKATKKMCDTLVAQYKLSSSYS